MSARPRSDEKARLILEAARRCLAERGYASTTISEVAREAGVSRGLLHYYFENKEDMLASVLRNSLDSVMELISPLVAQATGPKELATALSQAIQMMIQHDPTLFKLAFECWVVGRQSKVVSTEMTILFRDFRAALRRGLEAAKERGVLAGPLEPGDLGMFIAGLADGLALQLIQEPELAEKEEIWLAFEKALALWLGAGV